MNKASNSPQSCAWYTQPDAAAYQQSVLRLLDKFVSQRSGLRSCDYGSTDTLRKDQREIARALHDYRVLRDGVAQELFGREEWGQACRGSFSGRLQIRHDNGVPVSINYDTRCYFPTEYRRAACAVLACLVWDRARDATGRVRDRRPFIREYGRGVARRWLDS